MAADTTVVIRPYDKARDLDAVKRVWRETGWATGDDLVAQVEPFHDTGRTLVWEQDGAAESTCSIARGRIRYQDADLVFSGVTAVTTSHVARKRGAARQLLARMLAEESAGGAQVAALGVFDQGFYDLLGFGTGPYEHRFTFDPSTLQLDRRPRPPVRVTPEDWEEAHACLASRMRGHGGVVLDEPSTMKTGLGWDHPWFGLGYRDDQGRLTHFVFGEAKDEHGPYHVTWIAYQDVDQLLELLAALRTLGDQVHEVILLEPPHLQFQDLLRQPFRERERAGKDGYHQAAAWWQLRILDLAACFDAAHFPAEHLRFNLELHDPAVDHLPDGIGWGGTAGRFVVTLGETSGCEPGSSDGLPTLRSGVGAFSRLLFGVREASALAVTTDLDAPPHLLAALDRTIRLPTPHLAWDL